MILIINDGDVEIGLDDVNSNGHLRKLHEENDDDNIGLDDINH